MVTERRHAVMTAALCLPRVPDQPVSRRRAADACRRGDRGRGRRLSRGVRSRRNEGSRAVLDLTSRGATRFTLTTGWARSRPAGHPEQQLHSSSVLRAHRVGAARWHTRGGAPAMLSVRPGLAAGCGVRPELADPFAGRWTRSRRGAHFGSIGQADLSQMARSPALTGRGADGSRSSRPASRRSRSRARGTRHREQQRFSVGRRAWGSPLPGGRSARSTCPPHCPWRDWPERRRVPPAVAAVRPHDGARATIERVRGLLSEGALLNERAASLAAGSLCFKVSAGARRGTAGALARGVGARGRTGVVRRQPDRARRLRQCDFHRQPRDRAGRDRGGLRAAGVAQAVTIACERVMKLLDSSFTGCRPGLRPTRTAGRRLAILANGQPACGRRGCLPRRHSGAAYQRDRPGSRTGSRWLPPARGGCLRWPPSLPARRGGARVRRAGRRPA